MGEENQKAVRPIVKTAVYECKWGPVRGEYENQTKYQDVSVVPLSKESAAEIENRLRASAIELGATINGCHNVQFKGFSPTVEVLVKKAEEKKAGESARVIQEIEKQMADAIEQCRKNGGGHRCYL